MASKIQEKTLKTIRTIPAKGDQIDSIAQKATTTPITNNNSKTSSISPKNRFQSALPQFSFPGVVSPEEIESTTPKL